MQPLIEGDGDAQALEGLLSAVAGGAVIDTLARLGLVKKRR